MVDKSNVSLATRLLTRLGFAVDDAHKSAGFRDYVGWFIRDYINNLLFQMSRNNWLFGSSLSIQVLRPMLNRWRGAKIGQRVAIGESAIVGLSYPEYVSIGDNCRISANVIINEHGRRLKGYKPGMSILDLPLYSKPIIIEDDCHIGVGAIILPGVTVGKGAIVGAGSVVRHDVPPYSLVLGNPAKVVKRFGQPSVGESEIDLDTVRGSYFD